MIKGALLLTVSIRLGRFCVQSALHFLCVVIVKSLWWFPVQSRSFLKYSNHWRETSRIYKLHSRKLFQSEYSQDSCCLKMQYWWHFHWKFTRLQTFFNFLFFSLHPCQVVKLRFTCNINISEQVLFAQSYRPNCAGVENARKRLICCETPAAEVESYWLTLVTGCLFAWLQQCFVYFGIIGESDRGVIKKIKFLFFTSFSLVLFRKC